MFPLDQPHGQFWATTVAAILLLAGVSDCRQSEVVSAFPEQFVGVGFELTMEDDQPVVVRTLPGGSADQGGVKPGDRLLSVNGSPTKGKSLGDVVMSIRGEPGTQVTLAIQRSGERFLLVLRRQKMAKKGGQYQREKP